MNGHVLVEREGRMTIVTLTRHESLNAINAAPVPATARSDHHRRQWTRAKLWAAQMLEYSPTSLRTIKEIAGHLGRNLRAAMDLSRSLPAVKALRSPKT
jgi:enoyl-CoA hydratase/carnithine racemase